MKNIETLFDLIDHPEKYPQEEVESLLSDPETRESYNLLCKIESCVCAEIVPDVDAEWERLAEKYRPRHFLLEGHRAASIAIIVFASLAAVAAGIGISLAFRDKSNQSVLMENRETMTVERVYDSAMESSEATNGSIPEPIAPILFENESLRTILTQASELYNKELEVRNEEAAELKLYFKLEPSLSLEEVIDRINTFEQINVTVGDSVIIIN